MSDISKDTSSSGDKKRPACRVAYTLNNTQPVICTIIGEQPLFYMDFEGEADDGEGLFESSDLNYLEAELNSLKKEIDLFDRFSGEFIQPPSHLVKDLTADKNFVTAPYDDSDFISIKDLIVTLGKSRMATAYLDFAQQNNVEIKHSLQVENACYDRSAGTIYIHPRFDLGDQILLAARELRRHWQHRHGALIHPLLFHPDSAVLINRAQSADLTISMVRIAWELQLSGIKEGWEKIENSSLNDLGRAFAYEAFIDFRTLNNGQASAAVFEAWFLSPRSRHEDKILIKEMLADNQGYVFDEEQSGKALTPALISALGSMPYGKNYLAEHAQAIMADPIFNEVRDRSNANFLWFIKFERSFRETERELQSEFETAAPGDRRGVSRIQDKSKDHNHGQTADIIKLFPNERKAGDNHATGGNGGASKSSDKRRKNEKGADIVYLR